MLDECRGTRFEEMLVSLSTSVLEKVLSDDNGDGSRTKQLLFHQSSAVFDRKSMLPLAISYRASLSMSLCHKKDLSHRYRRFGRLLDTNDRDINQRSQALESSVKLWKQKMIPQRTVSKLRRHLEVSWEGDAKWVDNLAQSNRYRLGNTLLERAFDLVWNHVATDTMYQIQPNEAESLLENLEKRVVDQKERLQKWKIIQHSQEQEERPIMDRGSLHRQYIDKPPFYPRARESNVPDKFLPTHCDIVNLMRSPRNDFVNNTGLKASSPVIPKARDAQILRHIQDTDTSSIIQAPPISQGYLLNSAPRSKIGAQPSSSFLDNNTVPTYNSAFSDDTASASPEGGSSDHLTPCPGQSILRLHHFLGNEIPDIAEDDLGKQNEMKDDCMGDPSRYSEPSLAERTRMSLAFASPRKSRFITKVEVPSCFTSPVGVAEDGDATLQNLGAESIHRAPTLLERTRQSMSLMSSISQGRTQSHQPRISKVFPRNQFQSQRKDYSFIDEIDASVHGEILPDLEVDYETIFMSRPKIALSPRLKPLGDIIPTPGQLQETCML